MSLWSKAKEYVSKTGRKTGEVAEKVGYTIGRKAGEMYQKRWGPEGREKRIAQYKARTQELKAKTAYVTQKQRYANMSKQKQQVSVLGKSTVPNYDYITGGSKKKPFKMKEFQI